MKKRFSKSTASAFVLGSVVRIVEKEGFDLGNGTAQLLPRNFGKESSRQIEALINRAVEYGRVQAFKQVFDFIGD